MKGYKLQKEDGTLCPSTYQTAEIAAFAAQFLWEVFGKDYQVVEVEGDETE